MSFKLPRVPSPKATPLELADFAELLAWHHGASSSRELVRMQNQVDDNDSNAGCDDDEVENTDGADEAFQELERRAAEIGLAYPFRLIHGQRLEHQTFDPHNQGAVVYRYLLLCTRLSMSSDRDHAGLNGTELFEELSASVLRTYLGVSRAKSMVFGTAVGCNMPAKVQALCGQLGEGGGYDPIDKSATRANDGDLDAVVWVPFEDGKQGKIILFVQSKTGTSWRDQITQSRPIDFSRRWFADRHFLVEPVRAFCVAESINSDDWKSICIRAGLLVDRARIVGLSSNLDDELFEKLRRWTVEAKEQAPVSARGR